MPHSYPNRFQIEEMFARRANANIFHTYLADDFSVTVVGQDFHLGGHYTATNIFHKINTRIVDHLKLDTLKVEIMRVIGGGESAWAAVETLATAVTTADKHFRHEWVDLVRFDSQGKIAQMREFLDSGLVGRHIDAHEGKEEKK